MTRRLPCALTATLYWSLSVRLALLLGLGFAFMSAGHIHGADRPKDPSSLEGTWLPISAELAGQPFPEAVLKTMKLLVKDDAYTVHVGEKKDVGTFKTDLTKKPMTMDIHGTEGPNKGKTLLAIFEVNGDSMKVCYDLSGEQRPTEFKTKPSTQLFLVTYKKAKP
jgi:uncharacterized protein (TIGR03067 family)